MKELRNELLQFRVSKIEKELVLKWGGNSASGVRDGLVIEAKKCFGNDNKFSLLNRELRELDEKIGVVKSNFDRLNVKRELLVAEIEKEIEKNSKEDSK